MADEITVSGRLTVAKGALRVTKTVSAYRADMTGTATSGGTQSIPTTAAGTALTIETAVGTPGFAIFTNLDATNYVEIGTQHSGTTFMPFMRINALETSPPIRLATTAPFARANTGAVELEKFILEA